MRSRRRHPEIHHVLRVPKLAQNEQAKKPKNKKTVRISQEATAIDCQSQKAAEILQEEKTKTEAAYGNKTTISSYRVLYSIIT